MGTSTEAIRAPHPPHRAHSVTLVSAEQYRAVSRHLIFTTVRLIYTISTGIFKLYRVLHLYSELGEPSQRSGRSYEVVQSERDVGGWRLGRFLAVCPVALEEVAPSGQCILSRVYPHSVYPKCILSPLDSQTASDSVHVAITET